MLCDICKKKEATVHYTEIVHNQMIKMDICEDCAQAKGIGIQSPFSISDLLSGLAEIDSQVAAYADPVCPCCGLSFSEFRKHGRLGCSECYSTFKGPLESLLHTIHKNTRHKGKKLQTELQSSKETLDIGEKIAELKKELHDAVNKEEYEYAAELRDQIKELEIGQ